MTANPELPDDIKQLLNDAVHIKDGGYSHEALTLKLLCAFIRDQYTRTHPVNTHMLEALKEVLKLSGTMDMLKGDNLVKACSIERICRELIAAITR